MKNFKENIISQLLSQAKDLMQFSSLKGVDSIEFITNLLILHYLEQQYVTEERLLLQELSLPDSISKSHQTVLLKEGINIYVPKEALLSEVLKSGKDILKYTNNAISIISSENRIDIFIPIYVDNLSYDASPLVKIILNINTGEISIESILTRFIEVINNNLNEYNSEAIKKILNKYLTCCSHVT